MHAVVLRVHAMESRTGFSPARSYSSTSREDESQGGDEEVNRGHVFGGRWGDLLNRARDEVAAADDIWRARQREVRLGRRFLLHDVVEVRPARHDLVADQDDLHGPCEEVHAGFGKRDSVESEVLYRSEEVIPFLEKVRGALDAIRCAEDANRLERDAVSFAQDAGRPSGKWLQRGEDGVR